MSPVASVVARVRRALLDEARRSPQLLADLAGLEAYIVESYHGRALLELLQNADDAGSRRFVFINMPGFCIAANDGRVFTEADLLALCRSAASGKVRGPSIGYRGIGFKSVIGFAERVQLYSGEVAAEFSRERTAREIPAAARVPVIRIPHPDLTPLVAHAQRRVDDLLRDGFTTVFAFAPVTVAATAIELDSFDASSLLFLDSIESMLLEQAEDTEQIAVERFTAHGKPDRVRLRRRSGTRDWLLLRRNSASIAIAQQEGHSIPLEADQAVAHAFLPTEEQTGFGFKLNGDLSTDPSRRTVILDELTCKVLADAAVLLSDTLADLLSGLSDASDSAGLVAALGPTSDPRTAVYRKRALATEFLGALRLATGPRFEKIRLRPAWLNGEDFRRLARAAGSQVLAPEWESAALTSLLLFLGAKEAGLADLTTGLTETVPSAQGCAELVAQLVTRVQTRQLAADSVNREWRLWIRDGQPRSLAQFVDEPAPLDAHFLVALEECRTSRRDLKRLLVTIVGENVARRLVPEESGITTKDGRRLVAGSTHEARLASVAPTDAVVLPPIVLRRWQSAEQHVLALLNSQGYSLNDVSRQNLGYDLEGRAPGGHEIAIEVKSLDYVGQTFVFTSNEIAVATDRAEHYVLALVAQDARTVSIALIPQPVARLEFRRQCRLWVWECSEYPFEGVSHTVE